MKFLAIVGFGLYIVFAILFCTLLLPFQIVFALLNRSIQLAVNCVCDTGVRISQSLRGGEYDGES